MGCEVTEKRRTVFTVILALMALVALFQPITKWMRAIKSAGIHSGYTTGQFYADALDIVWRIDASTLVAALFFFRFQTDDYRIFLVVYS